MVKRQNKIILWWGRFDPDYSRNRILRQLLRENGYIIKDFIPKISWLGGIEAIFSAERKVDAVWVPNFRQRDHFSAHHFAKKKKVPLIFDPLISAWDKVVFERKKLAESAPKACKLKQWEQGLFANSDLVLADTVLHAEFYINFLSAKKESAHVVQVGAEEKLFTRQKRVSQNTIPEVLFCGSFIHLQGPEVIIEAAKQLPEIRFTLLGEGPLKATCQEQAEGLGNVVFEPWIPYTALPARIGQADILLGIFGTSRKAARVIPNKVYQALACGRLLITRASEAYPQSRKYSEGVIFVPPGSAKELANAIREITADRKRLIDGGQQARAYYDDCLSLSLIRKQLLDALEHIGL